MSAADTPLKIGLRRYLGDSELDMLGKIRVGIAGAGGLGSNTAMLLGRSGVENMVLIDYDVVDHSNLNRQQFWPAHIGRHKVDALAEVLHDINPRMNIELVHIRLDESNLAGILAKCPIWVEALDMADSKTMFVEQALLRGLKVVSASGICGIGGPPMQKRRMGNLVLVGDFETSMHVAPPMAPRVTQAAALMADSVLEYILKG